LSAVFIATLCLEPMSSTCERRDDRFVRISSLTDSRPELLTIMARWGLQRAGLHSQIFAWLRRRHSLAVQRSQRGRRDRPCAVSVRPATVPNHGWSRNG
jgi:hypothetical protein